MITKLISITAHIEIKEKSKLPLYFVMYLSQYIRKKSLSKQYAIMLYVT